MVEGDGLREIHLMIKTDIARVRARTRFASGVGDPNHRRRVSTGVALGVGINVKLTNQLHVEARFLFGFAECGFFNSFADIDKAAREGPPVWGVLAFDKNHEASADFDDQVCAETRCLGCAWICMGCLLTGVHLVIISSRLMKIGIPKEIKNLENRVAIVLAGVKSLKLAGHEVVIQTGAGLGSGISDDQYKAVGARIVASAKEAWDVDMVIKVKEPISPEFEFLRPGLILYTYLHLANEPKLGQALLEKKVRAIAYETIQLPNGALPLLTPMSEVAGRLAPQVGASLLEKRNGGPGILLGGVPGVARGKVTIIGGGVAGINSAKIAVGLGAEVTIIEKNQARLAYLDDIFKTAVSTKMSNEVNIEEAVATSHLVIGSVLIPGAKAPKLVTREMLRQMRPGSVVVDVAIDQGGCFETSRPTTHENPTYIEENVTHYCVTNMPGNVARTSTYALTNHTLPYALKIASGLERAIMEDPSLALGVNTWDGRCVYKAVADDLDVPYTALKEVLG